MFFEQGLEVDCLLNPITNENETGADLRENRTREFDALRDSRRAASRAEQEAVLDPEQTRHALAQWQEIERLALEILDSQSKDLEVACYLTEALTRLHGVCGLHHGCNLLHQLVQRYWNSLYPSPDEDGTETRIKPLLSLFGGDTKGTLPRLIKELPIVPDGAGNDAVDTFLWLHYDTAVQASRIEDPSKKAQRIQSLGYSLEDIQRAVDRAPAAFYLEQVDHAGATKKILIELLNELQSIQQTDEQLPLPIIHDVREFVEDQFLTCINHLAEHKLATAKTIVAPADTTKQDAPASVPDGDHVPQASHATTPSSAGSLTNRAQALSQIKEIACFFRETEPHTPIADALERVARWGNMPLHELMRELLPSGQARQYYGQLTGINLDGASTSAQTNAESDTSQAPDTADEFSKPSSPEGW
ncbi:type VI secretion system protein TssA [Marinobacter sp. chi1]|uniref:Type VI secretion system protein TssA n=1 Tax=Marinobacter suaedae TaxID=3057675 RepID=A0ABT8VW13_9GAMM|nr:type VI secretion system protein TssA [Marinobacter sp. chi1]MDO3720175.1 type VI secretion system protein TssA [Marinobacter sp. chi1]